MRVHKAAGGALVRAQRTEQTISPTLHGRTRTFVTSRVLARACVASAKLLQRQEWLGNVCNTRKYASYVYVCLRICSIFARASLTPTRSMYGCRQPRSRGYFAEGVVVGPGRILRVARSLSTLRIPQLPSSSPSLPSARHSARSPARPPSCRLGSKAKASPLLHLRRNDPTTRMRPSLFPFILVPVSGER